MKILLTKSYMVLLVCCAMYNCSNDHKPNFKDQNTPSLMVKDFSITINEHPLENELLGTIETNIDATFTVISENPEDAIHVDAATGDIYIADTSIFDYEINNEILATVQANTSGEYTESTISIKLNNIDDIAFYLTDSKDNYVNAEAGQWIEITEEEYNFLATKLHLVTKSGLDDFQFDIFAFGSGGITPSYLGITVANDNGHTLPHGSYCFAFKYIPVDTAFETHSETRVKLSTNSVNSTYNNLGSVLPSHGGGEDFFFDNPYTFVLKGNTIPINNTGYLAMYAKTFIGYKTVEGTTNYYTNFGDVSDLSTHGTIASRVFMYQGLSTTQKQWD
ncbi:hypothetical protein [uncultured Psychroserpens sp.]|uniref:hypothetical protein n=1 Tax=uncultured Psychroserpens sp. TaxID=255436 RepID=UPI00262DC301|nr:hypothetical protein [uncultured Psychroserpens sp.]